MSRRGRVVSTLVVLTTVVSLFALGVATAKPTRLDANLKGENEVGGGDEDGTGHANITLRPKTRKVCFNISWENISDPEAGHIHKGKKGVNGDVFVTLFDTLTGGGEASGCTLGVSRTKIRKIKKHPRRYYVNLHTGDFPDGALRGQLHR